VSDTEERQGARGRIRQLWVAHDDAGERLAARHINAARFKAIIDGQRDPSSYDLAAIADAFGTTVAWLLTGDDHGLDAEEEQALREETIAAAWHLRAERAEAAVGRVRRLCETLADASCRPPVREMARDVLRILDGKENDGD
jgi:hypothetical protein